MSEKLITVFGATGNQGGSVINTILTHPKLSSTYALRAITRDLSKPAAQSLATRGVELAKADLNDPHSISTAVTGSHGVFAVTNYWETMSKATEITQGRNIVDACLKAGVKHLVWSALPNATEITGGELSKIEHFDSKAEVAQYAESAKSNSLIVSYFMPGFFMTNLLTSIKTTDSSAIALSLPWHPTSTWIPLLDIRTDTGKFVGGLFEAGNSANGKFVQGVSEWIHPVQITDLVTKLSGHEVKMVQTEMTVEIASNMPKIPEELMQNMMLIRDWSYYGKGAEQKQGLSDGFVVEGTQKVGWEAWARAQKWEF